MNENPWERLPDKPPFVLPEDEEKVLAFNDKAHEHYAVHLDLIPEPFAGRRDAPIVLLGNNPGVRSPETAAYRRKPAFVHRMRSNLRHLGSADFPFLYLDPSPDVSPPSREWWERKLKPLLREFGNENVAKLILAVEFFPYVSHRYGQGRLRVPSQEYSFDLVRKARNDGAVIVLTRGERRWLREIPELAKYPDLVRLREPQRAPISPGNCRDDGYQRIVRKIRAMLP